MADTTDFLRPLSTLAPGAWAGVAGVFTDIDDTLTTNGAITADALAALQALRKAGLPVIAVTGRPVGWSLEVAGHWPLSAIVAENGAVALVPGHGAKASSQIGLKPASTLRDQLSKIYLDDATTRARNHTRLQQVAERVLREVPGARLARDSAGRETDIAIDHSEFTQLDKPHIDQVVALMRSEGLHATVSSIHINGWIGEHDKWRGACWIARELLGTDLPAQVGRWVYVGDSTNDQAMFRHFANSVGVANIRRFAAELSWPPHHVTQAERGAGFAEVAQRVLADRPAA